MDTIKTQEQLSKDLDKIIVELMKICPNEDTLLPIGIMITEYGADCVELGSYMMEKATREAINKLQWT